MDLSDESSRNGKRRRAKESDLSSAEVKVTREEREKLNGATADGAAVFMK